ncbi:hypothetical protein SpCBS45565_g04380 [Spizellomyces sp. 'palustris']|nr:hypothetical protein SpCBS45565_g04380 [Spizellomyces sp. 'palustris']
MSSFQNWKYPGPKGEGAHSTDSHSYGSRDAMAQYQAHHRPSQPQQQHSYSYSQPPPPSQQPQAQQPSQSYPSSQPYFQRSYPATQQHHQSQSQGYHYPSSSSSNQMHYMPQTYDSAGHMHPQHSQRMSGPPMPSQHHSPYPASGSYPQSHHASAAQHPLLPSVHHIYHGMSQKSNQTLPPLAAALAGHNHTFASPPPTPPPLQTLPPIQSLQVNSSAPSTAPYDHPAHQGYRHGRHKSLDFDGSTKANGKKSPLANEYKMEHSIETDRIDGRAGPKRSPPHTPVSDSMTSSNAPYYSPWAPQQPGSYPARSRYPEATSSSSSVPVIPDKARSANAKSERSAPEPRRHSGSNTTSSSIGSTTTCRRRSSASVSVAAAGGHHRHRRSSSQTSSDESTGSTTFPSTTSSNGGGKSYQCETCGKVYKHPNCLLKHKWEHTEHWKEAAKFSLSKHQQVQLLEAASILVGFGMAPQSGGRRPSVFEVAGIEPLATEAEVEEFNAGGDAGDEVLSVKKESLREGEQRRGVAVEA